MFRITGQRGESEFVPFSAQGLRAKPVPAVGGVELGSREPVFDIVVSAAKKSTFSRLSQNETAKECYKLGFFDPANADAALAALEMTEFPRKEYDGFALPAGEYMALRVIIGEGAGRNWWCVV